MATTTFNYLFLHFFLLVLSMSSLMNPVIAGRCLKQIQPLPTPATGGMPGLAQPSIVPGMGMGKVPGMISKDYLPDIPGIPRPGAGAGAMPSLPTTQPLQPGALPTFPTSSAGGYQKMLTAGNMQPLSMFTIPTTNPGIPGITPGTTPGATPGIPGITPGSTPGVTPGIPGNTPGAIPGATPGSTNPLLTPPAI